jgi:hypothetical protein
MRTYQLHYVYRAFSLVLLYISTETTVKELIDFNYISWSPMPRAVGWYICVYLWYAMLTIAYKIQIDDKNNISVKSLIRTVRLRADEITNIKDAGLFLKISHQSGSFTATTLIDGVANIKTLFPRDETKSGGEIRQSDKGKAAYQTILKVIIALILIAFAAYVEYYDHTRLAKKHQVIGGEQSSTLAN